MIGKPPGSDEARGMPTYPAIAGLESARARVAELHAEARRQLAAHGWHDEPIGCTFTLVADPKPLNGRIGSPCV